MEAKSRHRRLRRSIGVLMVVVAASAAVFSLVRPAGPGTAVRLAKGLIKELDPNFDPGRYRAVAVTKSADQAFWRVQFRKVAGPGRAEYVAAIPDRRVRAGR
jgi:hypothetical protein